MKYSKQAEEFIVKGARMVSARNPFVSVVTCETARAVEYICDVGKHTSREVVVWKPGIGFTNTNDKPNDAATADVLVALQRIEPGKMVLYVFQDMKILSEPS